MNGGVPQCSLHPATLSNIGCDCVAMHAAASIRWRHVTFVRGEIKPLRLHPQKSFSAQAEADPLPRNYLCLTEQ